MLNVRRFLAIPLVMLSLALIVSAGSAVAQSQPQTNKASEPAKSAAQDEKRQQDQAADADKAQSGTPKQQKPKQGKPKADPKVESKDQRELEEEEDI